MLLRAATDGAISGTGTAVLQSHLLGGVLITADGTNNAVVIVRKENATGKRIFSLTTKIPMFIRGPIANRDDNGGSSQTVYYDISGTGAAAQLYEWVQ